MLKFVLLVLAQAPVLPDVATARAEVDVDAGTAGTRAVERETLQTVVTGSRTETKSEHSVVSTEVITRAQIERLGVRDLPQLVQQHPGVEMVYTNRGTGLRLQGMDPEYVLILIDGQRIAGRSGPFTDISRFSLRDIERVEIVKGPAAALYGADAIGGVVNLITRRPQTPLSAAVRGMFGTLLEGDVRGNVSSKLGPFELQAGAGYRTRNPFDWKPEDVAHSGPGVRRIDADAEVAYAPSDAARLWLKSAYVLTDLNAIDLNETGATFERFQRTEQFDVSTGGQGVLPTQTQLTMRAHFGLFRDQFLVDQLNSRALDEYSSNLTRLWEGLLQFDHRFGRHRLMVGAEGLSETLASSRLDPQAVSRGRLGAFIQDEWVLEDVGPRLAVVPGLRFDADTRFGTAPSPRLALKFDPMPELTFRMAWGLGFRPPSFSELYLQFSNAGVGYVVRGNAALTSEHSNSVNVGVDWRPPLEGALLSASAWHTSLTNLINVSASGVPNPDDPVTFGYENVANAYTQGVELSGRMRLSRGAYVDVAYMGLDARDITRNRPLEGRSNHRVNVQLMGKYRPVGLEAIVRATWHSPRPFYSGTGLGFANVLGFEEKTVMASGYVDLEVQLTYAFRQWLKFFVNGYNLTNAGDQDFNPRPPRGVIGGVTMEY